MSDQRARTRGDGGLPRSILSAETAEMPAIVVRKSPEPQPSPTRAASSLLGSGPEISRNVGPVLGGQAPDGRPRSGTYARPPEPPPVTEQLLAFAQRWRTILRLSLAGIITLAVVVGYRAPAQDQLLTSRTGRTENRSAVASATDSAESGSIESRSQNSGDEAETVAASAAGGNVDGSGVDGQASATDGASNGEPRAENDPDGPGGKSPPVDGGQRDPSTSSQVPSDDDTVAGSQPSPGAPSGDGTTPAISDPTAEALVDDGSIAIPTIAPSGGAATTLAKPGATTTTARSSSTTTSSATTSTTTTTSAAPAVTTRIEAESGQMLGTARARSSHKGYSGSGYVGDLINEGSGVTVSVDGRSGGNTPFLIRYSAGTSNGPPGARRMSVLVNGVMVTDAQMQRTKNWKTWSVVTGSLDLASGQNTITIVWQPGDTGWVNLDYIEIN